MLSSMYLPCVLSPCRGARAETLSPLALERLLQGLGPGVGASQLDALQQELERGNAQELRRHMPRLLPLLVGDALQPIPTGGEGGGGVGGGAGQAMALHLLGGLVSGEGGGDLAVQLASLGAHRALLESVTTASRRLLLRPGGAAARSGLVVLEAQLALLLRLAAGGGGHARSRRSAAKVLVDASALPALTSCSALDLQPEEPGAVLPR